MKSLHILMIFLHLTFLCSCSSISKSTNPQIPTNHSTDHFKEANARNPSSISPSLPQTEPDSSVSIDYELERNHYTLIVLHSRNSIQVQNYQDHRLIQQEQISLEKYEEYLKKASLFILQPQSTITQNQFCRGPFTVTIRHGDSLQISKGCRSLADAAISRLIRDGEFLLYSGK